MRIIRYQNSGGAIEYGALSADGTARALRGSIYGRFEPTDQKADIAKTLAPVDPAAIFCIGLNYRHHAAESGAPLPELPVVFMKSPSALQNPGDPIELPRHLRSDMVDFEAELAVIIGRPCKNVPKERALDFVLGYTCANDVSARDWQLARGGGQWCRGKTFDTFAP
ncbi:MAG: fumarylacetoacetate hydrolase family protein, partial [Gammaproteobacteria bacterium]